MNPILRFFVLSAVFAAITVSAPAKTVKPPAGQVEYKRADQSYYLESDVTKVDPTAAVVTTGYTHTGDSYFLKARKKPAKEVYVEISNDWIEPVTPPDMPKSLNIAPDAMQIREPQGDVQVAQAASPTTFAPATDGMALTGGAVVKTGANGSAAILLGGVNSARLAPNSEAAVQQTVVPGMRTTVIDLHSGTVFSKVGQFVGEKQDYQVKTPMGVAAARGTDFVTMATGSEIGVCVAEGTVEVKSSDGKLAGTVRSLGKGPMKMMQWPAVADPHAAMAANAGMLTTVIDFIPLANVKTKALHAKTGALTANEKNYLGRIKKMPVLIKLALVEPPAPPPPPPAPVPPPAPPAPPAATAAPTAPTATASPAPMVVKKHPKKKKPAPAAEAAPVPEQKPIPAIPVGAPSPAQPVNEPPSTPTEIVPGTNAPAAANPNGLAPGPGGTTP